MARAAAVTLVAGGLAAIYIGPASADSFQQGNNAPTVTVVGGPGVFSPLYGGSTANGYNTFEVTATDIDTNDGSGSNDLKTVVACFALDGGNCSVADPQSNVKVTWTENGGSPTVSYANGGTTGGIAAIGVDDATHSYNSSLGANSVTIKFRFSVSRVATETQTTPAHSWSLVSLVATDDQDATGSAGNLGAASMAVNHFSAITSNRVSQSFGTLANGQSSTKEAISGGTIVANGGSDITYRIDGDFADGAAHNLTNRGGSDPTAAPAFGQFGYNCKAGDTYPVDDSGAVVIPTAAGSNPDPNAFSTDSLGGSVDINTAVNGNGTTEAGTAAANASCELTNGGTGQANGTTFSASVVTGTTADAVA